MRISPGASGAASVPAHTTMAHWRVQRRGCLEEPKRSDARQFDARARLLIQLARCRGVQRFACVDVTAGEDPRRGKCVPPRRATRGRSKSDAPSGVRATTTTARRTAGSGRRASAAATPRTRPRPLQAHRTTRDSIVTECAGSDRPPLSAVSAAPRIAMLPSERSVSVTRGEARRAMPSASSMHRPKSAGESSRPSSRTTSGTEARVLRGRSQRKATTAGRRTTAAAIGSSTSSSQSGSPPCEW